VGPTLLPVFQQIGIYDEILAAGKFMTNTTAYDEALQQHRPNDYRPIVE
jgi:hypothetical protein